MTHVKIIKFENCIYEVKLKLSFNIEFLHFVEFFEYFHKILWMCFSCERLLRHSVDRNKST